MYVDRAYCILRHSITFISIKSNGASFTCNWYSTDRHTHL